MKRLIVLFLFGLIFSSCSLSSENVEEKAGSINSITEANSIESKSPEDKYSETSVILNQVYVNFEDTIRSLNQNDKIGNFTVEYSYSQYLKSEKNTTNIKNPSEYVQNGYYPNVIKLFLNGEITLNGIIYYNDSGYNGYGLFKPDITSTKLIPLLSDNDYTNTNSELLILVNEYTDTNFDLDDMNFNKQANVTIKFSQLQLCLMDTDFQNKGDVTDIIW